MTRAIAPVRRNSDGFRKTTAALMTMVTMLALLLMAPGAAAAAGARDVFERGVEAAQEDNYRQAIEHFEAARRGGLDTGALHYNLGVAHYRVGEPAAAAAGFRHAIDSGSMVAPAYYQLGRIARERGDREQARAHLRSAAREATTDGLRQRARNALAALDTPASAPDYVYLALGGGHDSNIALTPSNASGGSAESDQFLDAVLVGRLPISDRTYLRGSVYIQRFLDQDDSDLTTFRGGVGRVGRLGGDWRWDAWIDGRHQRYGGEAFENAALGGGQLQRPLSADWSLEFDYRLKLVRGASGFGFLDGVQNRLDVSLDERGRTGWDLSAGIGVSDRDDRATADDFFSFSYSEFRAAAGHTFDLGTSHHLTFSGDWRRRDYDGQEIRNAEALGAREDDLIGLGAALDRQLGPDWSARASVRVEERDSTLNEFDYDRELIRLRLERVF